MKQLNINYIRILKILLALLFLTIGGMAYIGYRPDSLILFSWFDNIGLHEFVETSQTFLRKFNIAEWGVYNMPAALWLFSYLFVIDSIWEDDTRYTNKTYYRFFITILPVLALLSEFLQLLAILPGTFDVLDLCAYILAILLFLTIKLKVI